MAIKKLNVYLPPSSLIVFILLFTCFFSSAQDKIMYDSVYTLASGIKGQARFQYRLGDQKELIKDGTFIFTAQIQDSTKQNHVDHVSWKGNYSNNEKDGKWTYETNSHEVRIGSIEDYNVSSNVYTESEKIEGSFNKGVPQGKWSLETNSLINGEEQAKTALISIEFDKAKVTKEFNALFYDKENHKITIAGRAINGLMHGKWKYVYREEDLPVVEIREYENGFLKRLSKTINGQTSLELTYPLSNAILESFGQGTDSKAVDLPVSTTFSDGYPRDSKYIVAQKNGIELLDLALQKVLENETSFTEESGLPLGTNRMVYEIEKEEKNMLQEWPEIEFEYRSKVNALRADQDLHNGTDRSTTLQMIYEWVNKQLDLLQHIDSWNNIIGKNEIVYYNRTNKELINYLHTLLHEDKVVVNDTVIETFKYQKNKPEKENFLFIIHSNFKERIQMVDSLSAVYAKAIGTVQFEDALGQTEIEIQTSLQKLDTIFLFPHPDVKVERVYEHLKSAFLGQNFHTRLAKMRSDTLGIQNKKVRSDSLWNEVQIAGKIDSKILEMTKNHHLLDSLYTEYVFDPFTFTEKVPKRTKKKLYDIGYEDTYDALIEEAAVAQTIEQVYQHINQIVLLQQRFFYLHDKETSKLERKLKKRTATQKKLEFLQI